MENPVIDQTSSEEKPKYTINEAIQKAGGFGRFQLFHLIICIVNFLSTSFWLYNFNLLTLGQVYRCHLGPDEWIDTSKLDDICVDGQLNSY